MISNHGEPFAALRRDIASHLRLKKRRRRFRSRRFSGEDLERLHGTLETLDGFLEGSRTPAQYLLLLLRLLGNHAQGTPSEVRVQLILLCELDLSGCVGVVRKVFEDASECLKSVVVKSGGLEDNGIVYYGVNALSSLVALQEPVYWKSSHNVEVFLFLLGFALDPSPKIRNCVLTCVEEMFSGNKKVALSLSKHLEAFFVTVVERSLQMKRAKKTLDEEDSKTLLALELLQACIPYLPRSSVTSSHARSLIDLLRLAKPALFVQVMNTFHALFMGNIQKVSHWILKKGFVAATLQILLDHKPSPNDTAGLCAWAMALSAAQICFFHCGSEDALAVFPSVVNALLKNFATMTTRKVLKTTSKALCVIVSACLSLSNSSHNATKLMVEMLEVALSVAYSRSWVDGLFPVFIQLFATKKEDSAKLLGDVLVSLVSIRENPKLELFVKDVDKVLGAAMEHMGIGNFVRVVPLNIPPPSTKPSDAPRTYLLPLMKRHCRNQRLAFFPSFILPLVNKLEPIQKGFQGKQKKDVLLVIEQLWDMFPSLCVMPVDLASVFPKLAKKMGHSVWHSDSQRQFLSAGLANLINSNMLRLSEDAAVMEGEEYQALEGLPRALSREDAQKNIEILQSYAKDFIPCLFNGFLKATTLRDRNHVRRAVREFLSISSSELVNKFFVETVRKALQKELEVEKKKREVGEENVGTESGSSSLHSLASLFIPFLHEKSCVSYFKACFSGLKKGAVSSFKILALLCKHAQTTKFFPSQAKNVLGVLKSTKCTQSIRKFRLECWNSLLRDGSLYLFDLLPLCLNEIVLSTRNSQASCRNEAFEVLRCICDTLLEIGEAKEAGKEDNDEEDGEDERVKLMTKFITTYLLPSLAIPHPKALAGALNSLAFIMYTYTDFVMPKVGAALCRMALKLLESDSKELLNACVSFWFVAVKCGFVWGDGAKELVESLFLLPASFGNTFRRDIKIIVERLIKIEGEKKMLQNMPNQEGKRLVSAIQKKKRKKENKRKTKLEERRKKNEEKKHTFQQRFLDEDVEDLLSTTQLAKVTTVEEKAKTVGWGEFRIDSETGRPVFEEEGDSEEEREKDAMDEFIGEDDVWEYKDALEDEDDDEEKERNPRKRKTNRTESEGMSGKMYRSKKGQGDVKKSGKYDPFAYIRLDPKTLNKRNRRGAADQYAQIMGKKKRKPEKTKRRKR